MGGGDLDLDGGVAAGVEDLSGVNLGDGHCERGLGWVGLRWVVCGEEEGKNKEEGKVLMADFLYSP